MVERFLHLWYWANDEDDYYKPTDFSRIAGFGTRTTLFDAILRSWQYVVRNVAAADFNHTAERASPRRQGWRLLNSITYRADGSVAEWLACWTELDSDTEGPGFKSQSRRCRVTVLGKQTAYTHCASVRQAAKLAAALLMVAGVTAGLAESNGSLPPGL